MSEEGEIIRAKKIKVELVNEGEIKVTVDGDAVYTVNKELNDEFDSMHLNLKRHEKQGWEVALHVLDGMVWGVDAVATEVEGKLVSVEKDAKEGHHKVVVGDRDDLWVVPSMMDELAKLVDKKLVVETASNNQVIGWEDGNGE